MLARCWRSRAAHWRRRSASAPKGGAPLLANVTWAGETFDALRPGMAGQSYVNNLTAEDGRAYASASGIGGPTTRSP